jgi:enoyl-CoA hydratase/carnithine racemase
MLRFSQSLLQGGAGTSCTLLPRTLIKTFGAFQLYALPPATHAGIVEVDIAAKHKLNLLDDEFMASLHSAMDFINHELNDQARVAILSAAEGRPFSAGLDLVTAAETFMKDVSAVDKAKTGIAVMLGANPPLLSTGKGMPAMRAMEIRRLIKKWQSAVTSIARCRVPVIAAINGHCVGGATSLITACDMRFCTTDAVFSVREARIGIAADIGVLQRLPRIVGEGHARELCLTARDFGADHASAISLVTKVLPNRAALVDHARAVAQEIASCSPIAVQGTKEVMNFESEKAAQDSLDFVCAWNSSFLKNDDLVAAAVAFKAKQKPMFTNYVLDAASTHPRQ